MSLPQKKTISLTITELMTISIYLCVAKTPGNLYSVICHRGLAPREHKGAVVPILAVFDQPLIVIVIGPYITFLEIILLTYLIA